MRLIYALTEEEYQVFKKAYTTVDNMYSESPCDTEVEDDTLRLKENIAAFLEKYKGGLE